MTNSNPAWGVGLYLGGPAAAPDSPAPPSGAIPDRLPELGPLPVEPVREAHAGALEVRADDGGEAFAAVHGWGSVVSENTDRCR